VTRPDPAELLASGRELFDQFGEQRIVTVRSRCGAQVGDKRVGLLFPVPEEFAGDRVEEGHPQQIHVRTPYPAADGDAQRVSGDDVQAAIHHIRRPRVPALQDPPHARADLIDRLAARYLSLRPRMRELVQIFGGLTVKIQSPRQRTEHLIRRITLPPLLQLHVVVRADPTQHRHLVPPQPRRPATMDTGQPGPLRRRGLTTRPEKRSKVVAHAGQHKKPQVDGQSQE
jgi:hypothetical protein